MPLEFRRETSKAKNPRAETGLKNSGLLTIDSAEVCFSSTGAEPQVGRILEV